jgi:hypothetical protein
MSYFPDSIMPPNRKDESQDVRGNKHIITGADHNKHDEAIIAIEKYITANEARFSTAFSGMNTATGVSGFSGFSAFSGGFHLGISGQSNLDLLKFVVEAIKDAQDENVRTTSQIVPIKDPSVVGADGTIDFPDSWDTLVTTLSQEVTDDSVDDILADEPDIVGLGEDVTLNDFFEIGELEIGDTSDMPESGYITLINHVSMRRPFGSSSQTSSLEASGFLATGLADKFNPISISLDAPSISVSTSPFGFGFDIDASAGGVDVNNSKLTDNGVSFADLGIPAGAILYFETGANAGKTVTVTSVANNQLTLSPDFTLSSDTNFRYSVYVVRTGAQLSVDAPSQTITLTEPGVDFAAAGIQDGMSIVFMSGVNEGLASVITVVAQDTLTLTYNPQIAPDANLSYRLNSIFNLQGTIGGFSGIFMTHGFSGSIGAFGFSGTVIPPEDGTPEEQGQFDKMLALGANVEIMYYRGISGNKLLRLSRERRGSVQGMHLAGDLVFKGELSIAAAPSMWVAKDDNSLGHLECFVDPTGKLKMATRDTEDFLVLDAENFDFAYAQFQATLVRNPLLQPLRVEE